jgi:hypothetical protein
MAVIVKCDPPNVSPEGVCIVEERIFYGAQPQSRETVYIWEAETAGGIGLAMRGHIEQARLLRGRVELRLQILPGRPTRPLTKDMLASHRDEPSSNVLAGLARKLYRQAHNKIAPLSADEVHLLNDFF